MKSTNIRSATGRSPVAAAPIAAPMKPLSVIGVSSTRSRPNSGIRPLVTPIGPPQASSSPGAPCPPATSSPITMTRGSRRISCASASLIACRKDFFAIARAPAQYATYTSVSSVGRRRHRRRLRLRHRVVDLRRAPRRRSRRAVRPPAARPRSRACGRCASGSCSRAQPLDLARAAIGLRVALEMPVIAIELRVDQARAAAVARPLHRLARRLVDGEEVAARRPAPPECRSPPRGRAGCRRPTRSSTVDSA